MIATTTRISISVKPFCFLFFLQRVALSEEALNVVMMIIIKWWRSFPPTSLLCLNPRLLSVTVVLSESFLRDYFLLPRHTGNQCPL